MHISSRTAPMPQRDISNVAGHPSVDDGELIIYFESEETKRRFMEIPVEHPEKDMPFSLDNPTDECVDEG